MKHSKQKQYQIYADLLGIDAGQIDDVWLELDNALFIDLADGSSISINHSCNYSNEHGVTTYSDLHIKQPTILDIEQRESSYPLSKDSCLALLKTYFKSTWGKKGEYVSEDSYRKELADDAAWIATCRDTAAWLATA